MFFFGDSKKAKAKRRNKKKKKKKQREAMFRRTHIIIEARKKHMKSKKKNEENIGKGGVGGASGDHEQKDVEISQTMQAGKGLDKLRKRQKSLTRSRNTHLAKLQQARGKMVARART